MATNRSVQILDSPFTLPDTPLYQDLHANGSHYSFSQIVQLLEAITPGASSLGQTSHPNQEAVTIKSRVSLAIPTREVYKLQLPKKDGEKPIIWINFLTLAGIQGPLPTPYTEMILERLRQKDTSMRDFLDIFNHRLASLWHLLHKKVYISLTKNPTDKNTIGQILLSLCSLDSKAIQNRLTIPDRQVLSFHQILWPRQRSLEGLKTWLFSHFKIPVRLLPWQGGWRHAPKEDLSHLGITGQFQRLGCDLVLGRKSWDQSFGIAIAFHGLNWHQLCSFLPFNKQNQFLGGKFYPNLKDIVLFYLGIRPKVIVHLHLVPKEMKHLQLNRRFALGWNSWLSSSLLSSFQPKTTITIS